nr:hypothetical protein CFP56_14503 [Quercus suber]
MGDGNDGFNLNTEFNLNEEVDLNSDGFDDTCVKPKDNVRKRDCIDLNLDVNGDLDDDLGGGNLGVSCLGNQKRECDFDLNLEVCEEIKDADGDGGVVLKATESFEIVVEI